MSDNSERYFVLSVAQKRKDCGIKSVSVGMDAISFLKALRACPEAIIVRNQVGEVGFKMNDVFFYPAEE